MMRASVSEEGRGCTGNDDNVALCPAARDGGDEAPGVVERGSVDKTNIGERCLLGRALASRAVMRTHNRAAKSEVCIVGRKTDTVSKKATTAPGISSSRYCI